MNDDERLQKLTELARRVWPNDASIQVCRGYGDHHCIVDGDSGVPISISGSPRALDALEAALSVLAGQQPFARFLEANVRLGSAVADYRTVLINIRDIIRVKYLDERPFDDTALELGTLRHLVVVLWKALESVEKIE